MFVFLVGGIIIGKSEGCLRASTIEKDKVVFLDVHPLQKAFVACGTCYDKLLDSECI